MTTTPLQDFLETVAHALDVPDTKTRGVLDRRALAVLVVIETLLDTGRVRVADLPTYTRSLRRVLADTDEHVAQLRADRDRRQAERVAAEAAALPVEQVAEAAAVLQAAGIEPDGPLAAQELRTALGLGLLPAYRLVDRLLMDRNRDRDRGREPDRDGGEQR